MNSEGRLKNGRNLHTTTGGAEASSQLSQALKTPQLSHPIQPWQSGCMAHWPGHVAGMCGQGWGS